MITRRFLSCFAEEALVARSKITVAIGSEKYYASGSTIVKRGWLEYYTYARIDERMLPTFKVRTKAKVSKVDLAELKTQPPKRYTKAGLISELEKRNLGTKATRASIIDTLIRRRYVEGTSLMVTKFGMSVYDTLKKNCVMIIDERTTERLEEDMEKISSGEIKEQEVIDEGKQMLLEAIAVFDKNKEQITASMRNALRESNVLGKCPIDGGDLVVRRSRVGKQFAACANYPKCTNTYSLPQNALIIPTGKTCEHCHTPFVKVIRKGRRPFEMDLDPNCITKKDWAGFGQPREGAPAVTQQKAEAPIQKPKKEKKVKVPKAKVKVKTKPRKKKAAPEEMV
jgi:DNA topoisomerase-1